MCRGDLSADYHPKVDITYQEMIKQNHSAKFNEQYEVLKKNGHLESNKIRVKFQYGNDHKLVANPKKAIKNTDQENKHEWKMFVRMANKKYNISKYIQKITYGLDETFGVTEV